jgi:pantetheine-phosphate adenylyltransferase
MSPAIGIAMRTILYPGSFDPLTNGHVDIIERCARLGDRLVVAIGMHHEKPPLLSGEQRRRLLDAEAAVISQHTGTTIDTVLFSGLLVDVAISKEADVLVRGLRNGADFDYEMQMAGMNKAMSPGLETIFLAASPEVNYLSSGLIRQIAAMGGDITPFVPKEVARAVVNNIKK